VMPPAVDNLDQSVMQGLYRWQSAPDGPTTKATVLFSGAAQGAARQAMSELAEHYDVGVELWSATSYKALREEALTAERWNRLHPNQAPRVPLVTRLLADGAGPVVAVSDYMKIVPEQVARFIVDRPFRPLGTDGFGRSDTREALRRFFEVDAGHVVVAVLSALAEMGEIKAEAVADAIHRYGIDPEAVNPSAG
jgi:pyruvate dehydrogenase E1 component